MTHTQTGKRTVIVLLLLAGLLFLLSVYATHLVFTSKFAGANDFYSRWKGAQVYWQEGIDPYSEQATLAIQQGIYGRAARPDEDPGPFAYPFYTVFLLLPLVWLPYDWVQAIWLVILEFALVGGVLLCLSLARWRLPPVQLLLTGLWAVVFYHSARTVTLGQFAGLEFLWAAATLWALQRKHDIAAGVLLACTTIKPQMSFLLIPALLLWAVGQHRWRFLGASAAAMALLAGLSFILLPSWLSQFIDQIAAYPSYTAIGSPVWIIAHYYLPQLGTPVEIGLSVLLLAWLLFEWRRLPAASEDGMFLWLIGLTLIVTNLVALRTATTNYVILYIPLFYGLSIAARRWPKRAGVWLAAFYLLTAVGLWTLFLATVENRFEHPIVYLPLPIGLLIAFIWGRKALQKGPGRRWQTTSL
ncbi:MAG: DUF2029 domain-containing protein [Anaerolineae bacterium]|nr:DUF2029 domain-containing protein [Anaerolineae bacterium]